MFKKYLAVSLMVFVATALVSGCGGVKDEKTRLKEAAIDMACNIMKPMFDEMKKLEAGDNENADFTAAMELVTKLQTEMESKLLTTVQKHGFKDQDEFEAAGEKYNEDKAFEDEVKAAVKASCGFDMDEAGGF